MNENKVVIADFNMPFMSIVGFMVKVSLAAIPAVVLMACFWGVVMYVIGQAFP